jgi:Ala-tRNA(Pro) deacylase
MSDGDEFGGNTDARFFGDDELISIPSLTFSPPTEPGWTGLVTDHWTTGRPRGTVVRSAKGATMSLVTEHLRTRGLEFSVLPHVSAHSAVEEALTLGVGAREIAKAVVLDLPESHALAVIPGYRRIDTHLLKEACGSDVHLATEDEIERDYPQFELGAFPAVPTMFDGPMLVDPELLARDDVIIASGDTRESLRVSTKALFDAPNVQVMPLAAHPEDDEGKHPIEA